MAPDGAQIWQRDRTPVDGVRPSNSWRVGETIADRFALSLDPDLAPGDYTLRVILYDSATLAEQRVATLGVIRVER
jgi:hypothetical protein